MADSFDERDPSESNKPWEAFSQPMAVSEATKPWEEFGGETKPEGRSVTGHLRDAGLSLAKGVIAVPEAAVGLADIPTGGRIGKFLENEDGLVGFRPKQAREFLDEFHTDQHKAKQQEFEDADGVLDKAGVALSNPSMIANTVIESAPSMLGGGVVAQGLRRMAPKLAPAAAGALGEGAVMAGAQAEDIRGETDNSLLTVAQSAAAVGTGILGALLGWAGNRIAQRLGIGDVDTMLANGSIRPQDIAGELSNLPAKSLPRQVVEGAITEGLLEELPQSVSETILQNLALDREWSEGVDGAAVMGTLAGMAMGGGAAGIRRADQRPNAADDGQFLPDDQSAGPSDVYGGGSAVNTLEAASTDADPAPLPSEQMGLNPESGSLSSAAVVAVDSGAYGGILALPSPTPTMYGDRQGNISDTQLPRQIRDPDEAMRGLLEQAPAGVQPNAMPAEEQRRAARQERADREAVEYVDRANAAVAAAIAERRAENSPDPQYPMPKGLEPADREGFGRWRADVYRESVQALAGQLTKGGDVAYVRDAHDRIVSRTPSINPSWWQDMDTSVKPGSVEQAQRIVSKALVGGNLGPKQAKFIKAMMDIVDDLRVSPQQAEQNRVILSDLENAVSAEGARNQADYEQGESREVATRQQDDSELQAYLSGQAEPFSMTELTPEDHDAIDQELILLDDTTEATRQAGDINDGDANGNYQRAGEAGRQVSAQQGLPNSGRRAEEGSGAVPAGEAGFLESYTEQNLADRAQEQQRLDETEVEQQKRLRTDAERDGFALTGSDRTADVATAQGQEDLLAAPRAEQAAATSIEGRDIDGDWAEFSADSGTLGIPRNEMPQIKAEHRGAMVQFMGARGFGRQEETVPASSLKPTQAEYSRKKVAKAKAFTGGNRSILVSADGHVLDGHHQWMAARDAGNDVKIIRLDAPVSELLPLAHEFPSSTTDAASGGAATRQTEASRSPDAKPIEDAGEKLGGARKDELRTVRDRLDGMGDDAIASSTLSQLWPKGEIDRIEDPFHAAAYQAVRNFIPTKPRATYRIKGWVDRVKSARDILNGLAELGADASISQLRMSSPGLNILADQIELLMGLDRAHWSRVGDVKIRSGRYNKDGEMVPGSWVELKVDKQGKSFYGHDSIASALPQIRSTLEQKTAPEKKQKFSIYTRTRTGEVFIAADADKERRPLRLFEGTSEARKYLSDHHDDLVTAWEAVKNRENVTKADMRRSVNDPRVGQDYRKGKDITPEQFLDQFGFRGVEFGNWVKQGAGGRDRQGILNDAYDAFMDLADVVGVPPKALSLEGQLGIGFGSRGRGRASAHFEPGTVVINMTKTKGAGSLAHEWFHAVDNYFSRKREGPVGNIGSAAGMSEAFITYRPEALFVNKKYPAMVATKAEVERRRAQNPGAPIYAHDNWESDPSHPKGVRPEVEKAFAELVETLNASPMLQRSKVIDGSKSNGYWSNIIERGARSFETYVIARLADQGSRNDYLANVQTLEQFSRDPSRYPYLTADEQGPVSEAFDKLFSIVETRETDSGVAMFSRRPVGATRITSGRRGDKAGSASAISESDAIKVIAERIAVRLGFGARLRVHDSEQALFAAVPEIGRQADQDGARGQVSAVYYRGEVHVVTSAFARDVDVEISILDALAHEGQGHYGIRALHGEDARAVDAALREVFAAIGGVAGVRRLAAKNGLDLKPYLDTAAAMSERRRAAYLADELLAHLQGKAATAGLTERAKAAIRSYLGAIREWLRSHGFAGLAKGTDADIAWLLKRMREAAARKPSGRGLAARFSLSSDGAAGYIPDIRFRRSPTLAATARTAQILINRADRILDRSMKMPDSFTPEQKAAASKFDMFNPKQPVASMLQSIKGKALDRATQLIFDQFRPLKNISEKAFQQAHLSKATDGALEALATRGVPVLRDGAIAIDQRTNGFMGALSKLGNAEEASRFLMWVAGQRAEGLMGEGRENLFSADDIKAMKGFADGRMGDGRIRRPLYAQALKELNTYNKAVLDIAEQAGLIDGDSRADWESDFYIPFYRVMDDGSASYGHGQTGLVRQNVIKKLKGGTEKLGDPLENLMTNWSSLMSASMRNMAASEALQQASKLGIAERIAEPVKGSTWTMDKGQKVHWQVDEPMILDALESLNFNGYNNPAMKAASKMKQMLTIGVTLSPTFRVRNLIRDTLQALATADVDYNPIKNAIDGWKLTGQDSDTNVQLMAGGGAVRFGSFNDGLQSANTKRLLAMGVRDNQIIDSPNKLANLVRRFYDNYQEFGDRSETINRAVIYERVLAQTGSHLEASFAARDLMNFTSLGSSAAVRALAQVLPFFNARLQGMDRLVRGAATDPRRFWAVTGSIAMASALLYLLQADDEDYKALPDYVRDTYWPVKLGGAWVYIPKPFEVGSLGTVVERFTELAVSDGDYQAKDFRDSLIGVLTETLAMNPVPQIVRPAGEAWFNYDMFRQQSIDSMGMERLMPEDRYTANTSAAAVMAGRAFGASPQKIEHLMRGYFGWLGTQALNVGDLLGRTVMDMPAAPRRDTSQINNWFIVGDFVKEAGSTPSKYSERFYNVQREINTIYATANNARRIGDSDRYTELMSRPEMAARPLVASASRRITALSQRMREITADRTLSAAEKGRQLQALRQQRDAVARQVDEASRR